MSHESDEQLVRYLLGDLPADETERLDERSITDDALALRLRVLEDELVDRYARGERFGGALERFDRVYRDSAYLQERVRFAEVLHTRAASAESNAAPGGIVESPRHTLVWSLTAAAALILATAGYLFIANQRLQDDLDRLDARRASVEEHNARLQQQLDDRRVEPAPPPAPPSATFLLLPPRRGDNTDTTIAPRQGVAEVALRLQLEPADYARFFAALKDVDTDRIVWRSADLTPDSSASDRAVTITLPVTLLRAQRYAVELSGLGAGGANELLASYPIRVVLE
jgi:hypothetical protein